MIYTPVVGEACQRWSEIYQQPEGMFFCVSCQLNLVTCAKLTQPPRTLSQLRRPRQSGVRHPELAPAQRRNHLHYRWLPHLGPGRPRHQRHGHPHRQIVPLHCLCRDSTRSYPAPDPGPGHQQQSSAGRPSVLGKQTPQGLPPGGAGLLGRAHGRAY